MSPTLSKFLTQSNVKFDVLQHDHSYNAMDAATTAGIPMQQMAKAVVMQDEAGNYMMAVIPAMNRLNMKALNRRMGQSMHLVSEIELKKIFQDCELGAIPAFGQAFGMKVIVDNAMLKQSDVYIEAGDHEELVHMRQQQFNNLMKNMPHDSISQGMMMQ